MWSIKIDYVFHQNVMKLREIVVHMECYNLTKFHYILMKNIIVFYRSHLTDGPSVRSRWIRPISKTTNKYWRPKLVNWKQWHFWVQSFRAESLGRIISKLILAKLISQIWAFWLSNTKTNFTISQSKCSNLGNQFSVISFDEIHLEMILPIGSIMIFLKKWHYFHWWLC